MVPAFNKRISVANIWKQVADKNVWTKGGEIMGNGGCYVTRNLVKV